jgi:hypothetical protein
MTPPPCCRWCRWGWRVDVVLWAWTLGLAGLWWLAG